MVVTPLSLLCPFGHGPLQQKIPKYRHLLVYMLLGLNTYARLILRAKGDRAPLVRVSALVWARRWDRRAKVALEEARARQLVQPPFPGRPVR